MGQKKPDMCGQGIQAPAGSRGPQLHDWEGWWAGGWNATRRRVDLGQVTGDNLILQSMKPVKKDEGGFKRQVLLATCHDAGTG